MKNYKSARREHVTAVVSVLGGRDLAVVVSVFEGRDFVVVVNVLKRRDVTEVVGHMCEGRDVTTVVGTAWERERDRRGTLWDNLRID